MKYVLLTALLAAPFIQPAAAPVATGTEQIVNMVCETDDPAATAACLSKLKAVIISAYTAGRFEGICDASRTQDLQAPCTSVIEQSEDFDLLHRWYGDVRAELSPVK